MEERPKLLILYATQTGNALDAAEQVAREADRRGCSVKLLSVDEYDAVSLPFHALILLTHACLVLEKISPLLIRMLLFYFLGFLAT